MKTLPTYKPSDWTRTRLAGHYSWVATAIPSLTALAPGTPNPTLSLSSLLYFWRRDSRWTDHIPSSCSHHTLGERKCSSGGPLKTWVTTQFRKGPYPSSNRGFGGSHASHVTNEFVSTICAHSKASHPAPRWPTLVPHHCGFRQGSATLWRHNSHTPHCWQIL